MGLKSGVADFYRKRMHDPATLRAGVVSVVITLRRCAGRLPVKAGSLRASAALIVSRSTKVVGDAACSMSGLVPLVVLLAELLVGPSRVVSMPMGELSKTCRAFRRLLR